ncbi:apical junction component 1 homolog [Corythoichthys intestinalis]|uniref:apical junction component 1 homolog n=1 Tax=Corythoichthys intestinalis TaxID=161448 RepID=UPI0025A5F023|nr:apical junction component 1 homolog [Corythoichthys intestinalis]XP_057675262.1 apical junction component 1 homolog [Corythoichthys intestinalis]XP_057675263.1 apical junction component 1 homolog [Corythoichthys intestinalis]XP_061799998.1 apical junction component 1 homolog [Nerophis lumbriciformis]
MTLTGPPDLLVSSVRRDIKVIPITSLSKSLQLSKECDSLNYSTPEDIKSKINKQHCRTFEYNSLEYPEHHNYSMHSPYKKRPDRHGTSPDIVWNALGHHQRYRFSAPDIFNHRLTSQPTDAKMNSAVPEQKRRARSKSAPRVQTSLNPRSFESSSSGRKGRESRWTVGESQWRSDISPRKESSYAANRAHFHEVHPVGLGLSDDNRYSPYYAANTFEEALPDKPATSPHVRCRVDIKPNDSALHHPGQKKPTPPMDIPWQRHQNWGSRSLTVPRHFSYSRAPTPNDSLGTESRQASQNSCSLPNKYKHQMEVPFEGMSSSGYEIENRTHSSPNMPFQMFFEDDPSRYVTTAPPRPSSYFHDQVNVGQSAKVQYVHDQRGRIVQATGARPYYGEMEHYPYSLQAGYPKSFTANEPGPYIIQPQPTRIFYGDDPRSYQIQTAPPRFYYSHDMHAMPPLHHMPARAHYTDSPKNVRIVQTQPDDWYSSYPSGYPSNPVTYVSQVTPTRAQQEAVLTPWYSNPSAERQRIGTDSKSYSRSLDDILNSHAEREHPPSVQRHQSYNDLDPRKPVGASDDKPQPVVVNLSTSPRRYAALSLSDNSLIDQSPPPPTKNTTSKQWLVTPEITITDNDFRTGNHRKTEGKSASWDILDSRDTEDQHEMKASNKEKPHENSLQQSLEQLDELLADLVTDYKPPSRRASEDILDQLKKLIDEEEAVSLSRKSSEAVTEEPLPLDKQPTSVRLNPDSFQDIDGASDAMKGADECSPDQSPDEDDTMMCSNNKCRRTETLFNACLYFKSCHSCYTYYCSRNCRREDWDIHKESCVYGRIGSSCRHIIKHCRETIEVHKAFSRLAKVGYLSRGRGVLFLGFPNTVSSSNFLQAGLDSLPMSPTYLSLRELESFKDNLGEYCKELQEAGKEYDPNECFILNVSIAVGEQMPDGPSPRNQAPAVRKYAKVALASFSPDRKSHKKQGDMETLILTPPPGTADIDKEGEEGRKAREICFINIQRELRIRGVFLRHEYPHVYQQLCEFVENNLRFTPTTIYPIDKRTGKQFMCMIMAASEPRTLDWVGTPHLLDDII